MTDTIESLAESLKAVTDGWYSESLSIDLHDALIDHLTRARALGPEWLPVDSIPADWRDGRHLLGLMDAVCGPASIGELWWVDGWGWRAPVRDREPTPRYVMPLPQPPKEPGQ